MWVKGSCCNFATLPGRHKPSHCLLQTSTASLIFGLEVIQSNSITWQKANLLKEWTTIFYFFGFFSGLVSSIGSAWDLMSISAGEDGIQQYWFRQIQFVIDPTQRGWASHINKGDSSARRYQASSPENRMGKQFCIQYAQTAPIDLWERS